MLSHPAATFQGDSTSNSASNSSFSDAESPRFGAVDGNRYTSFFRRKRTIQDSISLPKVTPNEKKKSQRSWIATALGTIGSISVIGFGIFTTKKIQKLFNCSFGEAAGKFFSGKWDTELSEKMGQPNGSNNRVRTAEANQRYAEQEADRLRNRLRSAEENQREAEMAQYRAESRVAGLETQIRGLRNESERLRAQLAWGGGGLGIHNQRELETLRTEIRTLKEQEAKNKIAMDELQASLRSSKRDLRKAKKELEKLKSSGQDSQPRPEMENSEIKAARFEFESNLSKRIPLREKLNNLQALKSRCDTQLTQLKDDKQTADTALSNAERELRELRYQSGWYNQSSEQISTAEDTQKRCKKEVDRLTQQIHGAKIDQETAEMNVDIAKSNFDTIQETLVKAEEKAIRLRGEAINKGEKVPQDVPLNLKTNDELENLIDSMEPLEDSESSKEEAKKVIKAFRGQLRKLQNNDPTDEIRVLLRADVPMQGISVNSGGASYQFEADHVVFTVEHTEDTDYGYRSVQGNFSVPGVYSVGGSTIEEAKRNLNSREVERSRQKRNQQIEKMKKQNLLPDGVNQNDFQEDLSVTSYGANFRPYVSLVGFAWQKS